MSEYLVRPLEAAEVRDAWNLFRSAMHVRADTDEEWVRSERTFQPGRSWGAFDAELIGTARSFDMELVVPGGARVPMAAVTTVGVRADRTRRGVLSALMRAQLAELAERSVTTAGLYATEGAIYGRFGYGVATLRQSYVVDRRAAVLRRECPAGGYITLLDLETSLERLPGLYTTLGLSRPGAATRPSYWWAIADIQLRRAESVLKTAVHHGPDGIDGYVIYTVKRGGDEPTVAEVLALDTESPAAFAELWRYLLGLDLVDRISASIRPCDDATGLLLTDPRHCRVTEVSDELWLRLIDVPAALAARTYTGTAVVLEVVDPLLPRNSGRYRVSENGAATTTDPADLRLGVDTLAMLYFGTWTASTLAAAGRVEANSPAALADADRLFGTRVVSWCGTFF
jgi:predicted acetyltransferase